MGHVRIAGELCETGTVKVDAEPVQEVRILTGVHPAGREPDLALLIIDLGNGANDPVAAGDLGFHLAGWAVVQVEVIPAVALTHPNDFPAFIDVVPIVLRVIAVESGRRLVDYRSWMSGGGIHFDDPVQLVAALVVLKREGARILAPFDAGYRIGVGKECGIDESRFARGHVDEYGLRNVQRVAGLGVLGERPFGLHLIDR